MTCNGTLITAEKARQLADAGLNTIAISIDGIEETHDLFRQQRGCFRKAMEGIDNLRSVGIEPQVTTVVHKKNYSQLEQMYEYFRNKDIYSGGF